MAHRATHPHLSTTDLAKLIASGAVPAGPAPLPGIQDGAALEVERIVSSAGLISLANKQILVAERLGGMLVGVRIEEQTLLFFDPTSRELLRTRPNPLTPDQALRLRGVRPAGPPPRPSSEPIRIQRRASDTGVIVVAGQKVSLGRTHRGQEVEILVSETTLAIQVADGSASGREPHRARVIGTVAPLGCASRIGSAQQLFVDWFLWRPIQRRAHG